MAENRIAYGLAKKYGIDTTGMSPGEVWEALKKKGITPQNAYDSRSDVNDLAKAKIQLSKQEYAVLRAEVMRKNSAEKGKVKPTNFAFTSNYFYVYSTTGGDNFVPLKQFDIEKNREKINYWLERFGGKNV